MSETQLITDERGEHVAIQRIRLTEVDGPRIESGAIFTATGERVTLGSADGCDVVLRDRTVSRWHAELTVRDGRVVITDLGSSNGTTVNGVRVERAFVSSGHVCTSFSTGAFFGSYVTRSSFNSPLPFTGLLSSVSAANSGWSTSFSLTKPLFSHA